MRDPKQHAPFELMKSRNLHQTKTNESALAQQTVHQKSATLLFTKIKLLFFYVISIIVLATFTLLGWFI